MSVPKFDQFIFPLLKILSEKAEGIRAKDAYDMVADVLDLSSEERDELLPSGRQPIYQNRIGWAHDRLKRAGFSESPRWGVWKITEKGLVYLTEHSSGIGDEALARLSQPQRFKRLSEEEAKPTLSPDDQIIDQTPEERIDGAITELYDSLSEELIETIINDNSPEFFEHLVLDVLGAMGYGASHQGAFKHNGRSHDGGIDGIIALDRLGLEKVYVQAKCYATENKIPSRDVRDFCGALSRLSASKGVFITTSTFTREALAFVKDHPLSIVLINGEALGRYMIEYGVGVQDRRTVRVVEMDRDYFAAE